MVSGAHPPSGIQCLAVMNSAGSGNAASCAPPATTAGDQLTLSPPDGYKDALYAAVMETIVDDSVSDGEGDDYETHPEACYSGGGAGGCDPVRIPVAPAPLNGILKGGKLWRGGAAAAACRQPGRKRIRKRCHPPGKSPRRPLHPSERHASRRRRGGGLPLRRCQFR